MNRALKIGIAVVVGTAAVAISLAGLGLFGFGLLALPVRVEESRSQTRLQMPELQPSQPPQIAPPTVSPVTPTPANPASTQQQYPWSLEPVGAVQMTRGQGPVTMSEPGLVRFDTQTGEVLTWHWPRSLSQYGAQPQAGSDWAATENGLLVHLPDGKGYQIRGGSLLWIGKEGALFWGNRPDKTTGKATWRYILVDQNLQIQMEYDQPEAAKDGTDWRRAPDGTFVFKKWNPEAKGYTDYRLDLQTGVVSPIQAQGYRLQQTDLFSPDCGGGFGHQLKVYKDGQLLYSLLDAVAPRNYFVQGAQILADGQTAVIGTASGPALLKLADGTLAPAPELAVLKSDYLMASPTDPRAVAAEPEPLDDGRYSFILRTARIGQTVPPNTFQLNLAKPPQTQEVYISSHSYWSEDGKYLQVAVHYPDVGGRCGGVGDPHDTYLAPVKTKGDWRGPMQVRITSATRLYAIPDRASNDRLGAPKRSVAAGELLTVKNITFPGRQPVFVIAEPEGDAYLVPDPAKMEWVAPAS